MPKKATRKGSDKDGLTPLQRRFAYEYVIDCNATAAAIRAGSPARSAKSSGHQFIHNPNVWKKIQELQEAQFKRAQASADAVLAEWANLGFSDPGKLVWMPGDIDDAGNPIPESRFGTRKMLHEMPPEIRRTIKSIEVDERGRTKLTLWPKDTALTNLGRHKKLLNDAPNINITLGFSERLRAAREKRLNGEKS